MFKSDIIFNGYYGHKNTGDDAFVEVSSWGARKFWQKNNNRFLAKKNLLPKTRVTANGFPFSIPKTYNLQKEALIKSTDFFISSGGSTIYSKLSRNNPKELARREKERGRRIKIGAIGVSIGPFQSIEDERAVIEYLKSIDFLALRDKKSYDFATSIELPYNPVNAFDMAALLPEVYDFSFTGENREINREKIIGISVCPYESILKNGDIANEHRRNIFYISLIKEIISRNENIKFKFLIINGNEDTGDRKTTQEIILRSQVQNYEILDYDYCTENMWNNVVNCDFIVTTRLHAGIFACFAQRPFMQVEYHRKCSDFIDDVGFDSSMRIFDGEGDIKQLCDRILSIINYDQEYNLPKNLTQMISKARLNFSEIKL